MVGITIGFSTVNLDPGMVRRHNQAALSSMYMQDRISTGHVKV
ncbi:MULTISPECIES: hypothetical protein [Klebsiella]|uniref:Uncharacterized protein n=1 Tax=Klebsiella spallanzanii TaxID=2587528 RepID=A0A564MHF8_9ENTR|nr:MULTISPECIES: hypothetical protein [Klebsiella]VUS93220.1 hypothetical protein SB6408_05817 [Klebsiella spallanzanii]